MLQPGWPEPAIDATKDKPPSKKAALEQMLRETKGLWRGRDSAEQRHKPDQQSDQHAVDSGFAALNALLPTVGWPLGCLIEVNVDAWGNGELQLLLPLMVRLSANNSKVAMVAPPYLPYAPGLMQAGVCLPNLVVVDVNEPQQASPGRSRKQKAGHSRAKDIWWSAEKLLRHSDCGLVLIWPQCPDPVQVRRLQTAAAESSGIGVVFHCGQPVDTPVALRLKARRCVEGVQVQLLKSRLGWRQHGSAMLPSLYRPDDELLADVEPTR